MKQVISWVCATLIILQMIVNIPMGVHAAGNAGVTVSTVTARPGDTNVVVSITISNNPGICGMLLKISYDQRLSLIDVQKGDALPALTLADFAVPYINPLNASWDGITSDYSDGDVLKLTFNVPENAEAGNYNIIVSYESGDVYDDDLNDLSLNLSNGYITVKSTNIHEHSMKKVPAKDADCITKGNIQYWQCTGCYKTFSDNKGQNEIFDVEIPIDKTNHIGATEIRNYKEPTETRDGYTGDEYCVVCNRKLKSGLAIPAYGIEENEPYDPSDESYQDSEINEWENPFVDIQKTDTYYNAIQFVYENGLFKGVSDTEFAPETTMTRAMFVTVLGRLAGVDVMYFTGSSFDDVVLNEWYAPYVEWASEYGIVNGYGDGRFGVNDRITVEQAAVIMARYAEYIGLSTSSDMTLIHYQDSEKVSSWAVEQMKWAVENKIYSGDNYYLSPQSPAKRSLVAEIIFSFVSKFN